MRSPRKDAPTHDTRSERTADEREPAQISSRFRWVISSLVLAAIACAVLAVATIARPTPGIAQSGDGPELIFRKTTVFKLLAPDHKLATFALDDPGVEGVACHFTVPEKGGWSGWLGLSEELSDVSLACRQVGPVTFKAKFEQGAEVFRQRRSLFFKRMRIVRGCDTTRNVLVYLVYSDKLIEGSPKNSTSTVPLMPWGEALPPKCSDFLEE